MPLEKRTDGLDFEKSSAFSEKNHRVAASLVLVFDNGWLAMLLFTNHPAYG